jgi:hypothetical protein
MPDDPASHDESDRLNDQARQALLGFSTTPESDLAELFLSNAPIRQDVRHYLAQALTDSTIFGCNVRFHNTSRKARSYYIRKEWYDIGAWMDSQDPKTRLELAQENWGKGQKYCEAALTYSRKVLSWVKSVQIPGTVYGTWSTEKLVEKFIYCDSDQSLPKPNRTLEEQEEEGREILALLKEMLEETEPPYSPDSE